MTIVAHTLHVGHGTNPVGGLVFEFVTTCERQHILTYFDLNMSKVYKNAKFPQRKSCSLLSYELFICEITKKKTCVFRDSQLENSFFMAETQNLLEMCSIRCLWPKKMFCNSDPHRTPGVSDFGAKITKF